MLVLLRLVELLLRKEITLLYLLQKYGYVHLSAGDLLREEAAKPDSSLGKEINEHIKNGSIVPVAVTCKLLENVRKSSLYSLVRCNTYLTRIIPKGNEKKWKRKLFD